MSDIVKPKQKSIKKNFIYNLIYQVFLIIVPVIVTPYVSRVLQADGVGQYSYSLSIVSYFSLLAALGFTYYAQRAIANCRDDKEKQSKIFWEIVIIRFISTLLSLSIFVSLVFLVPAFNDYKILLLILSGNILAVGIDVTFIFQGNEDFKQISIRNFFAKIIVVSCVFIFVRNKNDLWLYTLIQALSPLFSAVLMLPFLKKYLVKVPLNSLKPIKHLVPCLRLFIPTIAVSVYTMLDKTMIGAMIPGETTIIENGQEVIKKISDLESGYYNQAEKIIKIFVTIVTSLGTVMIPRNSYFFANNQVDKAKNNIFKGIKFAYFLAMPLMLGVICVANNFSPWFFGEGYEKVPLLMMVFSPLVVAIGLNNVFGIQYLIPSGQDTKYTISVTCGAVFNLGLNAILIPFMSSVGAAIASVSAEFLILIIQMIMLRKVFNPLKVLISGWKYVLAALIMFVPCFFMGRALPPSIINTLLIVLVGIATYVLSLIIMHDEFLISIFYKVKEKFLKNVK